MMTRRQKIAASATSLVAGAGLVLLVVTGSAGASAPSVAPSTGSVLHPAAGGPTVTASVGAGARVTVPPAERPTSTIYATSPAPRR